MTSAHFNTCLVQRLRHLRCRGDLCDARVTVKGQEFLCHRLVLVSASDYFKTSLSSSDQISWLLTVDDEDVSPRSFRLLLEILYGGNNLINHDTVMDILKCSAHFGIDFITKHIERYFEEYLKSENCLDVWLVAHKSKLTDLAYKSCMMAAENIEKIPENKLLSLHRSMLLILLSLQDKLTMDGICKRVLRWVEADQDARAGFLCHFLPFISFPLLSPTYLADLMEYRNHPSCGFVFDHLQDGIYFALKNTDEECCHKRRGILSQQSVPLYNTDISSVCVVVKATEFPPAHGPTLEAWRENEELYNLAPAPQNTGLYFATCTWRNELYLSGGNLLPTFFAVYKPCDNQWSVLPALDGDGGREKHSMAAINDNIYILGGVMQTPADDKVTSPDVWRYSVKSKTWSLVCHLPKAVQETAAAVLGHRIYLFGGINGREVDSDLVQCVDTVNDVAYVAGRLPSPTSMTRAVSNNGLIWVVLSNGHMLRMWEDFSLADQREHHLANIKSINTIDKPLTEPRGHECTVSFEEVARICVGDLFGVCIEKREMTVATRETGDIRWDMMYIDLSTGDVQELPTPYIPDAHCFHLHRINIPHVYLKKRTSSVEVPSRSSDRDFVPSVVQVPPIWSPHPRRPIWPPYSPNTLFRLSSLVSMCPPPSRHPIWPLHPRQIDPEQTEERRTGNQDHRDTTGRTKTFHTSLPNQKNTLFPEIPSVSSQSSDTESIASVMQTSPISPFNARQSEPEQAGERPSESQDHTNIRSKTSQMPLANQMIISIQSPRCIVSPMPNSRLANLQSDHDTTSERPSSSHEQRGALGSQTSLQNVDFPSANDSPRRQPESRKRSHSEEEGSSEGEAKQAAYADLFSGLPDIDEDLDQFLNDLLDPNADSSPGKN